MNKYLGILAVLSAIGGGIFIASSMSKEAEKPFFKHVDINDTINTSRKSVYLDVGHTPSKVGAISSTCKGEYLYNVEAVTHIHDVVANKKAINYEAGELSFDDRARHSKNNDLFISIHHDSMNEKYLTRNDEGCLEGTFSKGFSLYVSSKNKHFEESLEYAQQIGEYMVSKGIPVNMTHASPPPQGEDRKVLDERLGIYDYPNLRVVKNSEAPALLIEMGVITNPNELEGLTYRHQVVGEAISSLGMIDVE